MIGLWGQYAQTYLLILAGITTLAFAIPIFFVPLIWARLMLWNIPDDTDLVLYFGRCLGAFILVIEYFMFQAAVTGEGLIFVFNFLAAIFALMVGLHIYGAAKRIQPITETLEIGMYAVLLALTLLFYPLIQL